MLVSAHLKAPLFLQFERRLAWGLGYFKPRTHPHALPETLQRPSPAGKGYDTAPLSGGASDG